MIYWNVKLQYCKRINVCKKINLIKTIPKKVQITKFLQNLFIDTYKKTI